MPAAVPLAPERPPRRARYLVPLGTPRRGEILAVLTAAVVLASALFAPLTLALTVLFHAATRISRWRPVWLAAPACLGAVWLLATGPPAAIAAFTHGPASAAHLVTSPATLGRLPAALGHDLPGQIPVALILAAAAAAIAWWVRWLHTDEWDQPFIRPGLVSFCRRQLTVASVRSGGVLTRNGACLGVDRVTGRPATLPWRDAGAGVLVTGAAQPAVLAQGRQLAHAAIRRRKPVIVVDLAGSRELPGMLAAVCAATGAPLQVFGDGDAVRYEPSRRPSDEELATLRASPLGRWLGPGAATSTRISLAEVVRRRTVVLFALDRSRYGPAAETIANLVAADITAVYTDLGRKGVPAEGLSWFTECDGLDSEALVRLIAPGGQAGLAAVLTTTAPQTAGMLAKHVDAGVFHRLADWDVAATLAALTGTRLVPISRVLAQQAAQEEASAAPQGTQAGRGVPLGTMPFPVVPPDALCGLGADEFVLVTGLAMGRMGGQGRPSRLGRTARGGQAAAVRAHCQSVTGQVPTWPAPEADPFPAPSALPVRGSAPVPERPAPGRPA